MMAMRRVRIVCISDTHTQTPKLPAGDILIHAGDLTNQGTHSELSKTIEWLQRTDFRVKIVVCGNHDITCDISFYQQYGTYFHNKKMEDPQLCVDLFQPDPSIVYLNHEAKQIRLAHEGGAVTILKVFGSPYSPAKGFWAFGYQPEAASQLWDQIPLDTDLLVTHTPAKFHRDESGTRGPAGCEKLREALWRVRPRLFVCGHIHEGYGVEVVTWDLISTNTRCREQSVQRFNDPQPDSKKQFTIDLSSRARSQTLQNDGSIGNLVRPAQVLKFRPTEIDDRADDATTSGPQVDKANLPEIPAHPQPPFPNFEKAESPASFEFEGPDIRYLGARGQEGPASGARSDQEGISGREGRLETCIVNAAFMRSNWPHKGGKKFHKPIVIDLDLPVVDGKDQLGQLGSV